MSNISECRGCVFFSATLRMKAHCNYAGITGNLRTHRNPDGSHSCPPGGKGKCPYYTTRRDLKNKTDWKTQKAFEYRMRQKGGFIDNAGDQIWEP